MVWTKSSSQFTCSNYKPESNKNRSISSSKHKRWEPSEDKVILAERKRLKGNKWQQIANKLPGRSNIDL